MKEATGGVKGALVDAVVSNSPAATADLRHGDVITAMDDAQVGDVDDLLQAIGANEPGATVTIKVSRGSRQLDLTATLAERPTPDASR